MDEQLLSVRDVAREYGVSERTIRRWIEKGAIEYKLVGPCRLKRIRITRHEANKHLMGVVADVTA